LASIVQVPSPMNLTTAPEIEHTPELAASIVIATASVELASAVGSYVVPPTVADTGAVEVNAMFCDFLPGVTDRAVPRLVPSDLKTVSATGNVLAEENLWLIVSAVVSTVFCSEVGSLNCQL